MFRLMRLAAMFGGIKWLLNRLCTQEQIRIDAPAAQAMITSPLTVSGVGRATQHNTLGVRIREAGGAEVGSGTLSVSAALGLRGPFTGTVSYTSPGSSQAGRVEVYDTSPRDGNVTHLSSVEVTLS